MQDAAKIYKMHRRRGWAMLSMLAIALIAAATGAFQQDVMMRHYTIQTDKLSVGQRLVIAHLSDLHNTSHGEQQSVLRDAISAAQPDLIVLTGDIFDERSSWQASLELLGQLNDIAPSYFVMGNHEYYTSAIKKIAQHLQDYHITLLSDEIQQLQVGDVALHLAGLDDPHRRRFYDRSYNQERAMQAAFGKLDASTLNILLAHRPERIHLYKKYPFDIVLSGHAHGGQVRLPKLLPQGIYAPHQGLLPRYSGGLYLHGNLRHIVSRGLSVSFWLPRIYNPPELVIITITGVD